MSIICLKLNPSSLSILTVEFLCPSLTVFILKKNLEAESDTAQACPVVPRGNILVTGPFSSLAAVAAAVSSFPLAGNPQPRRQSCWEHLLGSLPLFPLLASLSALLPRRHLSLSLSPESVTAFSFICLYFPFPSPPLAFISTLFLLRLAGLLRIAAPVCSSPIAAATAAAQLCRKLPQVLIYLTRGDVSSVYFTVCSKTHGTWLNA